jgi:hypothetical protein
VHETRDYRERKRKQEDGRTHLLLHTDNVRLELEPSAGGIATFNAVPVIESAPLLDAKSKMQHQYTCMGGHAAQCILLIGLA